VLGVICVGSTTPDCYYSLLYEASKVGLERDVGGRRVGGRLLPAKRVSAKDITPPRRREAFHTLEALSLAP
jgi:hypothetical protein